MKVVRFPKALDDLVEAATYLGRDDPSVADRFFDRFEDSLDTLKSAPTIGSIRVSEVYGEIRIWFVNDFEKILILYKELPGEIQILRIIHSARDFTRFV
jgi:plasmid stabilization system protein ParE